MSANLRKFVTAMSLAILTFSASSIISCGSLPAAVGDTADLTLDTVAVPSLPATVRGVFVDVSGTTYQIEYETDDLGGIVAQLRQCDIVSVSCVSCCQKNAESIDQLNLVVSARIEPFDFASGPTFALDLSSLVPELNDTDDGSYTPCAFQISYLVKTADGFVRDAYSYRHDAVIETGVRVHAASPDSVLLGNLPFVLGVKISPLGFSAPATLGLDPSVELNDGTDSDTFPTFVHIKRIL